MRLRLIFAMLPLTLFAACDQLGIDSPQKVAERLEADAKAVGSACRQAGRALEDCYSMNPRASKAAVFAGWRDMDEYMRDNKLDVVKPSLNPPDDNKSANSDSGNHSDAATDDAGNSTDSAATQTDAKPDGKAKPSGGDDATQADQAKRSRKPSDHAAASANQ